MLYLQSVQSGKVFSFDEDAVEGSQKGGEGTVYPSNCVPVGNNLVAKIYHEHKPERAAKLNAMVDAPPSSLSRGDGEAPIVAWPVDLLKQARGRKKGTVIGYLMPEVIGTAPHQIYHPEDRRDNFPLVTHDYLLRCAASIAEVVSLLHQEGYVIGDINESNFLISGNGKATAIDADSFQVPDPSSGGFYSCEVGTRPYIPPELSGKDLSGVRRKVEHDRYGLAVLIFQLLMGRAPMQSRYKGSGSRSSEFVFPYGKMKEGYKPKYPPPRGVEFKVLHEPLRNLFEQCFHIGIGLPSERPNAEQWARALRRAEQDLSTCLWNRQHRYSPHLDKFGGLLKQCPWCEHKKSRSDGKDLFPSKFRVGAERLGKDDTSGFLQADMPGENESKWIGVTGVVGMAVEGTAKYLPRLASPGRNDNSDENPTGSRSYGRGGLKQRVLEWKGLWMFLVTVTVSLPLAWFIVSTTSFYELLPEGLGDQEGPRHIVEIDTDRLNVRAGPSTDRSVVATVQGGDQFDVLSTRSGWQKVSVQTSDGEQRQGWVYSEYTSRVSNGKHATETGKVIPPDMLSSFFAGVFPSKVRPIHRLFLFLSILSIISMAVNKLLTGEYVPNWREEIVIDREGRTWVAKRNWPIFISIVAILVVMHKVGNLSTETVFGKLAAITSVPLAGFCAYVSILPVIVFIFLVIAYTFVVKIW